MSKWSMLVAFCVFGFMASPLMAQTDSGTAAPLFSGLASVGAGLAIIGAGLGIGKIGASACELSLIHI